MTDERLHAMLDRFEIQDCITRLARGMDRHDVELARSSFHEGAKDDHATFIGTAHDMLDWANAFHDASFRAHQHHVTNFSVDVQGDEAHAETYVLLAGIRAESWDMVLGGGRYLDRLERRDGRWAIVDRVTVVEWWNEPATVEQVSALVVPASRDRTDPSYTRPLRVDRAPRNVSGVEVD